MHTNTCFGACLYSVDTHHGNLLKSLVGMNTVTFLFRGPAREIASTQLKAAAGFGEKDESEWTAK